jgi:hypothetical protein
MPLIPGKLPAGTCYGTPQQLLDIFSQYLSVTGTEQGVLYTTTENSPPLVTDVTEPTPRLWVDLSLDNSPLVYAYGGNTSKNWVLVGNQTVTKTFLYTAFNLPASGPSKHILLCNLPVRSRINWIYHRVNSAFAVSSGTIDSLPLQLDPPALDTSGGTTVGTVSSGNSAGQLSDTTSAPTVTNTTGYFGKWTSSTTPNAASKLYVFRGANPTSAASFTSGSITFWVNYTQLQG